MKTYTDDELKTLRELWTGYSGMRGRHHNERTEVLAIIDEALSRGARMLESGESEGRLRLLLAAEEGTVMDLRAALAKTEQERDALVVARDAAQAEVEKGNAGARLLSEQWDIALANARAVAFEEAARSLEGDGQLTTAIADYCAAKLRRWRDGAARPNGASGQWVAADVMELLDEALTEADCYLDDHGRSLVSVTRARAALSALESEASR